MGRLKNNTPLIFLHSHFTFEERLQLEFYLEGKGKFPKITSKTMLGALLHKHPKTIAREIQRGRVEHYFDEGLQKKMVYSADYAERKAREKDSGKGPQLKLGYDYVLAERIGELILNRKFSPYAVIAEFDNKGWPTETRISEKTLYNYVYEGLIPNVSAKDLLRRGKGRKSKKASRRYGKVSHAAKSITTRPEEADKRETFGHWEGDTVMSGKGQGRECLLTITERKTRTEITRKLPDKSSSSIVRAFDALERELGSEVFRRLFKSITFDNGSEFEDIEGLERSLHSKKRRTSIYFAHPYCASERGTNERHNGIIRRFIPKGSSMGKLSKADVNAIQLWMNNYPRKILKGKTPAMLLKEEFPNQTAILRFFNIPQKEAG